MKRMRPQAEMIKTKYHELDQRVVRAISRGFVDRSDTAIRKKHVRANALSADETRSR